MTKKIAEINIDLKSGGYVQHFLPVKSKKDFAKKMNKMIGKGEISFIGVNVDVGEIDEMSYRFHRVN